MTRISKGYIKNEDNEGIIASRSVDYTQLLIGPVHPVIKMQSSQTNVEAWVLDPGELPPLQMYGAFNGGPRSLEQSIQIHL